MFVFLFENFVGRARRFRRPRFGAKKEEKDEQRKKYSMKTNQDALLPLVDFAKGFIKKVSQLTESRDKPRLQREL